MGPLNALKGVFGSDVKKPEDGTSSSPRSDIDNVVGRKEGDAVAVGLPKAGTAQASASYTDTQISDKERTLGADAVKDSTYAGQDVEMKEETVKVAKTEIVKETVQVPTTEFEKFTVSKPVTTTEMVPETVRDIEMKKEQVTREEVVIDKETVSQPTTVMKPVATEVPRLIKEKKVVPQLHEEMRTITVVRPRPGTERVKVMRPVEVTKVFKGTRPVQVKRLVKSKVPVRKVAAVNITQPELTSYEATVQVPVTNEKHVDYEKPVTVIRSAEDKSVVREKVDKLDVKSIELKEEDRAIAKSARDWNVIPVGLPFTELISKSKNFTETHLQDEAQSVRQTKMEPKQFDKVGYEMKETEVEVLEVEMQDYEEEVVVSEMQEVEEEVEVTLMEEHDEEWPVAKETTTDVWTAAVTLEPVVAQMPEIAMEDVEVEKPRTVTKTETIEKAVPVEREVTVERPVTKHVDVEASRAVEVMKDVEIEKPVTTYEESTVQTPVSVSKNVDVSGVKKGEKTVTEQVADSQQKSVNYTTATSTTTATAVEQPVRVDADVAMTAVLDKELANAKRRDVKTTAGVVAGASIEEGHVDTGLDTLPGMDVRQVAPDAELRGGVKTQDMSADERTALLAKLDKADAKAEIKAGSGKLDKAGVVDVKLGATESGSGKAIDVEIDEAKFGGASKAGPETKAQAKSKN